MNTLPANDRRRFLGALHLLQSDRPGEVFAAAKQANRILARHGLGWADILCPPATIAPADINHILYEQGAADFARRTSRRAA